ncbi:1492_t:CDS:1, partial [Gigaspora margarita]
IVCENRVVYLTFSGIFHCYQNEREDEKDTSKAFIGCQNIKKIDHNLDQ